MTGRTGEVEDKGDGGKEKRENGGVSSVYSGGILVVHCQEPITRSVQLQPQNIFIQTAATYI